MEADVRLLYATSLYGILDPQEHGSIDGRMAAEKLRSGEPSVRHAELADAIDAAMEGQAAETGRLSKAKFLALAQAALRPPLPKASSRPFQTRVAPKALQEALCDAYAEGLFAILDKDNRGSINVQGAVQQLLSSELSGHAAIAPALVERAAKQAGDSAASASAMQTNGLRISRGDFVQAVRRCTLPANSKSVHATASGVYPAPPMRYEENPRKQPCSSIAANPCRSVIASPVFGTRQARGGTPPQLQAATAAVADGLSAQFSAASARCSSFLPSQKTNVIPCLEQASTLDLPRLARAAAVEEERREQAPARDFMPRSAPAVGAVPSPRFLAGVCDPVPPQSRQEPRRASSCDAARVEEEQQPEHRARSPSKPEDQEKEHPVAVEAVPAALADAEKGSPRQEAPAPAPSKRPRSVRRTATVLQPFTVAACAGDCGFARTWLHRTHCCAACTLGTGKHGARCQRRPWPEVRPEKAEPAAECADAAALAALAIEEASTAAGSQKSSVSCELSHKATTSGSVTAADLAELGVLEDWGALGVLEEAVRL
eukprot:TRINITY_DN81945_c0_g1_i1.p1 TRINITY_DN81945_c0_g1~~TRINITY_DN81945_c0_g1_i1.p1  ORF type:complete len:545 (-),score=104.36 TRINITY_DN81945_c0_g1_i1:172-1806(-)